MTTKIELSDEDKKSLRRILQDVSDQGKQYRFQAEQEINQRIRENLKHLQHECQQDYEVQKNLVIQMGFNPNV